MQKETKLYGLRAIQEAIEAEKSVDKVFLQKGLKGDLFLSLEKSIRKHGINVSYVPAEKLNRLTQNNHQGAVAQMAPISFYDLDELVTAVKETKEQPLFLVLDQLNDVRNFGAIIRTAECAGVDGIVIQKKGVLPSMEKVSKQVRVLFLTSLFLKVITSKMHSTISKLRT